MNNARNTIAVAIGDPNGIGPEIVAEAVKVLDAVARKGGHAFASGYPNSPTSSWIAIFDAWLARLRAGS